jgi:carbonic anhydrase
MAVLPPKQALENLIAGNLRFAAQQREFPNLTAARVRQTGKAGQEPYAAVLACSDSRCPVEHIFDTGVGDLFVVRVAGNQSTNEVLGSLEYCVEQLGSRLIVVLGHSGCGAMAAAASGMRATGLIPRILSTPLKAVGRVLRHAPRLEGSELAEAATVENIWLALEDILRNSRDISAYVARQHIAVVGALYRVETGVVDWLGEHPQQQKLAR